MPIWQRLLANQLEGFEYNFRCLKWFSNKSPRKLRLAFLLNLRNFKIRLYKFTKVFSQSSSCQKLFICLFYICQVSFHSQCPLAYSVFVAFYFYYFYFCSILSYYCALRQPVFPMKQVITGFFFSNFFNSLKRQKKTLKSKKCLNKGCFYFV